MSSDKPQSGGTESTTPQIEGSTIASHKEIGQERAHKGSSTI
jgi:hypothetical protein